MAAAVETAACGSTSGCRGCGWPWQRVQAAAAAAVVRVMEQLCGVSPHAPWMHGSEKVRPVYPNLGDGALTSALYFALSIFCEMNMS